MVNPFHSSPDPLPQQHKAVVVGASTGGPAALPEVLETLSSSLSVPIFVGQHMPPEFVATFADRLSRETKLIVRVAIQNQIVEPGNVYIAPGDHDMKLIIDPLGASRILLVSPSALLIPSIDVLMASVATVYGAGCLGIILTGMGVDGLEGMRAIKAVGGKTVVQDEATSAVYGMAQAVDDEHLADSVLPLTAIAGAITNWSVFP